MNQAELQEVLRKHKLWLEDQPNGEKANLQCADLRGAHLQEANLQGANLQEADLRGADLQGANLQEADLYEANLQGANLQWANLREANLREANLIGAKFNSCIGNSKEVKSLFIWDYPIVILIDRVFIGCMEWNIDIFFNLQYKDKYKEYITENGFVQLKNTIINIIGGKFE